MVKLLLPPISPAAPKPLYEQIIDGIKREVSAGHLPPHTPLPSFRILAQALLVSLITVKRAYEELERDGIIYRRQGLGTFVSENGAARGREVKHRDAELMLRQALREGIEAGLQPSELLQMAKDILTEKKTGRVPLRGGMDKADRAVVSAQGLNPSAKAAGSALSMPPDSKVVGQPPDKEE